MPFAIPLAIAAGKAMATKAAITAMGATATGLQIAGQYQAGKSAEAQAESQAAWHEYSAQLAEREARETQEAAAYEEEKQRKAGVRLKATQRARYAKAGVGFEGSPLEVMEQTAYELEMDVLLIRRGGTLGYQRYTAEAGLQRVAGKSALLPRNPKECLAYFCTQSSNRLRGILRRRRGPVNDCKFDLLEGGESDEFTLTH